MPTTNDFIFTATLSRAAQKDTLNRMSVKLTGATENQRQETYAPAITAKCVVTAHLSEGHQLKRLEALLLHLFNTSFCPIRATIACYGPFQQQGMVTLPSIREAGLLTFTVSSAPK